MLTRTGGLLLALASFFWGCNGGASDFRNQASEAARAADVTLDDLPAGWRRSESGFEIGGGAFSNKCDVVMRRELPNQTASYVWDSFQGPRTQGFTGTSIVFPTQQLASEAFQYFNGSVEHCRAELLSAFEATPSESNPGALPSSLEEFSIPTLASAAGHRLIATTYEGNASFVYEFIVIHEGRMLGILDHFSSWQPTTEEESDLAEIVANKLRTANAMLPD